MQSPTQIVVLFAEKSATGGEVPGDAKSDCQTARPKVAARNLRAVY